MTKEDRAARFIFIKGAIAALTEARIMCGNRRGILDLLDAYEKEFVDLTRTGTEKAKPLTT
jgi:hypothetical protein